MAWHPLLAQRRLEWWLAAYTVFWGVFLVSFPDALSGSSYVVMRIWLPASAWGCVAAVIGMFHLWALYINGRRYWSAYVRVFATAATAAVFTLALAAVIAAVRYGLAPLSVTGAVCFAPVWAAICAFMVAASDAFTTVSRGLGRLHGYH